MVIGPYDKRLKRSRCLSCIARHTKCSGDKPCSSCQRASLICRYANTTNKVIQLDNKRSVLPSAIVLSKTLALDKESTFSQHFFEIFLPRNQFSGRASEWTTYALSQLSQCRGHYFALSSLGALVLHGRDRGTRRGASALAQAVQAYQDSVRCLQSWIDRDQASWDPLRMLSLAFLLSLFELMYDTTGVGWNAHMGFGSSVLLNILGPDKFCSPQSLAVYREIRLFEISRAALFQQSTVLADEKWLLFDQTSRIMSGGGSTVLEEAFDLFLKLVMLHQRAIKQEESSDLDDCTLNVFAYSLRSQLNHFNHRLKTSAITPETNIACIYYHTMSIYLSGLCDYQVLPDEVDVSLHEAEIEHHVKSIISRTGNALEVTQVSAVFLLLPLRIAGNRCRTLDGCDEILGQLSRIEGSFGAAMAFKLELMEVWASR